MFDVHIDYAFYEKLVGQPNLFKLLRVNMSLYFENYEWIIL